MRAMKTPEQIEAWLEGGFFLNPEGIREGGVCEFVCVCILVF